MTAPTAAPPDLRELLREALDHLKQYSEDCPMVPEQFDGERDILAELIVKIDAALAQPPDAKPVYWDPPSDWLKDHEIPPMGSALQKLGSRLADMLQDDDWNNIEQMLFDVARECAAPQPPAGKSK
jgi:hypothetical protein